MRRSSPSVADSSTAPAPSPKKKHVRRSFQLRIFENASVPMTSTLRYRSRSASIIPCATLSANTKPAHTEFTSNAGHCRSAMPSFSCTRHAAAGCD